MIVVGSASAAADNVAIPAHQIGDLILVFARRANTTPPSIPTATTQIPTWITTQSFGANTLALTGVGAIATRTDHLTGSFTNASHICVLVLRADTGKTLSLGVSSNTGGSNNQVITYPALTLTTLNGTSHGVRAGTRGVAISTVGNPPPSYITQVIQPAGASALMSIHTRMGLTTNPIQENVSTTGTNAPNRAFTIEIREIVPPATEVVSIL